MNYIKTSIIALVIAITGSLALAPTAGAVNPLEEQCKTNTTSEICKNKDENIGEVIGTIVNVLLFIVGALSVLMIIIGGILYTTSGGDSGAVSKAKNTILYAIVGLVVAFVAFAIVNWVMDIF